MMKHDACNDLGDFKTSETNLFIERADLQALAKLELDSGELTKSQTQLRRIAELRLFMGNADRCKAEDRLAEYMDQLGNVSPLDDETQQALALKYHQTGSENAANLLIISNLRLVVKLAREYRRKGTDLLELIQEGNVGISEAIVRFDPYRKVKFISYAQYWIRAMILNYLLNNLYPVKFGNTRAGRKLFYNLKKARHELKQQGVEKPTALDVADYVGVSVAEVVRISAQMDAPPVAIDAPAIGYDGVTNGDLIACEGITPELGASRVELSRALSLAFDEFGAGLSDPREIAIWNERMLADQNDCKTLKELGSRWGVSKERIRQVEADIKERYKEFLVKRFGVSIESAIRELVA